MYYSLFGSLVILVLFVLLIVGLIKPTVILRKSNNPTRGKIFGYWFLSTIIILIITIILVVRDTNTVSSDRKNNSVLNKIDSSVYNQNKEVVFEKPKYLYDVLKKENFDYRDLATNQYVHRLQYRVKLQKEYSEEELKNISDEIIYKAPDAEAISILFYLPNTETDGPYTAGMATWAPNGKWESANKNYPKKLVLKHGGALGEIDKKNIIDLPLSKKKEIFFNLVRYENQGMNGYQSTAQIAKEYNLSEEEVNKIVTEGILKNWPMP